MDAETLAKQFHEAYELFAPFFNYKTRKASAVPLENVPENNRKLMIRVAEAVVIPLLKSAQATIAEKDERIKDLEANYYEAQDALDVTLLRKQTVNKHVIELESQLSTAQATIAEKDREIKGVLKWVNDLQSRLYINCGYCGHRYGPDPGTPVAMAEVLKKHVEQCPKHPMSALKADNESLRAEIAKLNHRVMDLVDTLHRQDTELEQLKEKHHGTVLNYLDADKERVELRTEVEKLKDANIGRQAVINGMATVLKAPRRHDLGCDEAHVHQPPKCCRLNCWCVLEAINESLRTEVADLKAMVARSYGTGSLVENYESQLATLKAATKEGK